MVLSQPFDDFFGVADAIKLGAVAGGQNYRFFGRIAAGQALHGIRQACRSKSQLFAYAQRRSLMVESDGGKLRGDVKNRVVCVKALL